MSGKKSPSWLESPNEVSKREQHKELMRLHKRIAELEDERDIFKRTLDKRDARIAELEDSLETLTKQNENLHKMIKGKRASIAELSLMNEAKRRNLNETR